MTVVVTGSSGLLSRHIVEALIAAGHEVVGVDTVPPTPAIAAHITADLTNFGDAVLAIKGASAVVHAAAIPRPTGRTAREVFDTNVAATFNVVEAAIVNRVGRLIYASSYSVLGFPFYVRQPKLAYAPIDEAHPVAPQDAYALSKWIGEEIVEAAVRRDAMSAVSLRMPWIQTPQSFPRDVETHRSAPREAARNLWSYLDARDAADAFVRAVAGKTEGHKRIFVSAADTFMAEDTEPLFRAAFPDVPLRRPFKGREAVFDLTMAKEVLGFVPRYSWRAYGGESPK